MSDENTNENSGENTNGNTNENTDVYTNISVKTNLNVNADVSVKKLDISETLTEGIDLCVKNIGPLLVNLLFWVLTIWIPYLNVGTSIGLFSGIVIKLSRGETISFTEIFNPKYRRYMGEYLLTMGLIFIGILIGIIILIIPGIIISIAWSFALILVIDKDNNPAKAIKLSNDITYGNKGRIFLIEIIASSIFSVLQIILDKFDNDFATLLIILTIIFQIIVSLCIKASMYRQLARDAE